MSTTPRTQSLSITELFWGLETHLYPPWGAMSDGEARARSANESERLDRDHARNSLLRDVGFGTGQEAEGGCVPPAGLERRGRSSEWRG